MATISNKDIAKAIYFSSKEKKGEEFFKEVVDFLGRKRLLSRQRGILESLEEIVNEEEGILSALITSQRPLKEKDKVGLAQYLKKKYEAKKVIFKEKIDERVLGGMKVEVGDEVIDLTLRNKIKKLQNHLTKSHE